MIGLLGPKLIAGGVILAILGGVWWKVASYMNDHEALEDAYDRQALELNQAVEVNQHNVAEMVRIAAQQSLTLASLQGQLDSEATSTSEMEQQLARLRSLEPEVRFVSTNETCEPTFDVHPSLADPFGVSVEPG